MGCLTRYTPSNYEDLVETIEGEDIEERNRLIRTQYLDADAIITALDNNTFDENFGKRSIKQILKPKDVLTNEIDNSALISEYVRYNKSKESFAKMQNDFIFNLIQKVLIEKTNSGVIKMVDATKIADLINHIDVVNDNLYKYKIELINTLRRKLNLTSIDNTYNGWDEFTTIISDTIAAYEAAMVSGMTDLLSEWDTYFMLKHFDQLLVDFDDFITLKPEFQNSSRKAKSMYDYHGPYVKYDTSFNPNEFASAEQYASSFIKILLDRYFKKVDFDGTEMDEAIGFNNFNVAMTRLTQWIETNGTKALRKALWNGVSTNWNLLIDTFINTNSKIDPDLVRTLKGIKRLLSKDAKLDNTIKEILMMQHERTVKYQFEAFRPQYDSEVRGNTIVPIALDDVLVDKQKGSIIRSIRYRVLHARKGNPAAYAQLKRDLGIVYNEKDNTITLSRYGTNGEDLVLSSREVGENKRAYDFVWKLVDSDGRESRYSGVNQNKIKNLIEVLFQEPIPNDYTAWLENGAFGAGVTLFDIYKHAIATTLTASEATSNGSHFDKYKFRYNDLELVIPDGMYVELNRVANFLALIKGMTTRSNVKNGLGNNLPLYQQKSAIQDVKKRIEKAFENWEGLRSGVWNPDISLPRRIIYEKSVLAPNKSTPVPIGTIGVRADYDGFGQNKNSAQLNFKELAYFDIFKSYYFNLMRSGNVKIQPTCLADKRTHFLIEYLTSKINIGGNSLHTLLSQIANINKDSRDHASSAILDNIREYRADKAIKEVIGWLNRFEIAFGLNTQDISYPNETPEQSFKRIQHAINTVEDRINAVFNLRTLFNNRNIANLVSALNQYELVLYGKEISTIESTSEQLEANIKNIEDNYLQYITKLLNSHGCTHNVEADLVFVNGRYHLNETLYNSFLTYCGTDTSKWDARVARERMAFAKKLFENHFTIDASLDKYVLRVFGKWYLNDPDSPDGIHKSKAHKWFNKETNLMAPFFIIDKSTGLTVNLTYDSNDIEKYFDSNNYDVEFNPVIDSYWHADVLLSNAFNDIIFGEDYGLECKYIKAANKQFAKWKNSIDEIDRRIAEIDPLIETGIDRDTLSTERYKLMEERRKLEAQIKENDYGSEKFFQLAEASRLTNHYKRTVHGGATFTPLMQGMTYGVSRKVKVAVIDDIQDTLFTLSGVQDKFTAQDGGGWASPLMSRMENVSYVDGSVGKNKKTIYSFVDPETGILNLIKWAEYEITNSLRRNSPPDKFHTSYEMAFKKMHSIALSDSLDEDIFEDVDISSWYDLDNDVYTEPLYVYNPETGRHYLISKISNNGKYATVEYKAVHNDGRIITSEEGEPIVITKDFELNTIYDIDQMLGGCWVETLQNGKLDFSEAQNDIVHRMVCDLGLKDKFVGFLVNASAIKSGQKNNNASNYLFRGNEDELQYFEIPTTSGGAQMNADHIITESEVTEMSQMISALMQNGLKTGRVLEVYRFIGQVAKEALGDIVNWVDDPSKEMDVYRWIGEALVRSFEKETQDTLGLAGAFIAKANRNLESHGLKTRIPLSAPTVKGKFEATISSLINKRGIRRKYPGGGFVQVPTFDAKLQYSFQGQLYSYSEFLNKLRVYNLANRKNISAYDALNDDSWVEIGRDAATGRRTMGWNNPFIKDLSPEEISSLDIDDTVIIYDLDENGEMIGKQIVRLNTFTNWSMVRHFSGNQGHRIAKWECRPRNLLGNRTFFKVNNQKFSLYDLDSFRASMYAYLLLDDPSKVPSVFRDWLATYVAGISDEDWKLSNGTFPNKDISTPEGLQNVYKFAKFQIKKDLKELSKVQNGKKSTFKSQTAFGTLDPEVVITDFEFADSEVLMGLAEAKAFDIENRYDLEEVQKDSFSFFKSKLSYMATLPANVPNDMYDMVLFGADRSTTLLISRDIHGELPNGLISDVTYVVGEDGNIWHNGENYGNAKGKQFYKYTAEDGTSYTVLVTDTFEDYKTYNGRNQLYTSYLANATDKNWENLAIALQLTKIGDKSWKANDGTTISNAQSLTTWIRKNNVAIINSLAIKKVRSWEAYKKGIGTRIPAQSMQSFTSGKIVGFTDDDTTAIHVSTMLCFMQGSDFDIDKLYWLRYGFTGDGMLATFTDLDTILDPEECLALPKPNSKINVTPATVATTSESTDESAIVIGEKQNCMALLKDVLFYLEKGYSVAIDPRNFDRSKWDGYLLKNVNNIDIKFFRSLLRKHAKSERTGAVSQIALRNTVVKGILDVLHDVSTQFNLQIPIEMTEQKNAANKSTLAKEEQKLTSDNPASKWMMQIQNIIGRDVIGIGASSLKAFFAATTYFNTITQGLADGLRDGTFLKKDTFGNTVYDGKRIWDLIRSLVFNSKLSSDRGLVTLANINYDDLYECVINNPSLQEITLDYDPTADLVDANSRLKTNDKLTTYIDGNTIHFAKLVKDLKAAADGDWKSPIDAAYSLSGLISAATDNAKELILAKINASSKFADIYTYLLSTGESFATIAEFMVNPVFNVVAMYADGLVFDPNTKFFDLENALDFVQDIQTLPIVDNKIFNRLLTNTFDNGEPKLFSELLRQFNVDGKNQRAVEELKTILGTTSNTVTDIEAMYIDIVRNPIDKNTREYTDQYKAILAFWYKQLRINPEVVKWLTDAFRIKIKATEEPTYNSAQDYEFDDIDMDDLQDPDTEEDMTRSYDYDKQLTHADWIRYYNYVTNYLVPKNQAIGNNNTDFLTKLRENIIPALKEQRMLAKILSINQGLDTQDFDEYKWIRDIESFINERYIDSKDSINEEFNLIKFLSDEEYQKRHIEYYEKVKSTYNILAVVSNTPHFWEMLKLSGTNRKILLKSAALKYERVIADKLLKMAKPLSGINHNGLSKGLTQKLNEQEYKILQDGVRDLIIRKWISTLGDIRLKLPSGKHLKYFYNGRLLDVTRSFEGIDIATADGLATFKWAMENYIINELKKDPTFQDNEFIKSLLVSYSVDRTTEKYNSFITLPVPLTNYDNNPELERKINLYQSSFNSIYRKKVPESLGIGDWTIGDLFYLYNLYVYKDGFGMNAMTRLFDDMIINDDGSLLVNNFYNYIAKLDSGTEVIPVISRISELTDSELQDSALVTRDEDDPMSLLYDFRLLFKDTTSAGTKFRIKKIETTNIVTGAKQTEYKFLKWDYSNDTASTINNVDKNYYMFPFSKWNPVVTINSNRVSINEEIEESVNGPAAVEVIVKHLQKSFGTRIRIVTINDAWLDKNPKFKRKGQVVKGFVHNGTIYVNTDHATASTPIHELMHVIFAAIKYGTEEQRKLYYDIMGLVNTKRSEATWDKYYKQVESEYEDYAVGSDFKEEVVIHVMEDIFTSGYLDALRDIMGTDVDSDFTIEDTRGKYNTIIIDAINKVFETKLKEDTNIIDILNKSLGEVVYDLSEGLFNFGESDFSQYYIPTNQRIARFKRIMYKEKKLTDNGKC